MGNITFKMFFLLTALLGYNFAMAQTGAPHTLRGESQVASVSLNWKSPAEAKTMQWHNDTRCERSKLEWGDSCSLYC